jgi:CDP-paratose synthetase
MNQPILLTGATGFVGSHIIELFIENQVPMILLKRSFSDVSKIEKFLKSPLLKFYDIDKIAYEEIFDTNDIQLIIHAAVNHGGRLNETLVSDLLTTNLIFPIRLIELGIKYNVKGFINTDTFFCKTATPHNNSGNYIYTKKNLLYWLEFFSDRMKIANIRLEHVYGERDSENKFFLGILQKLINKQPVIDFSPGHQKRDFVYVKDVATAFLAVVNLLLTQPDFKFKTFETGTGKNHEIRYFVEQMKKMCQSDSLLNFGAFPYGRDEIMESKADITELESLGWKPAYSIQQGLENVLTYSLLNK